MILISLIALLGTFLRLYLINDQIILNDEWHGLYYVINKSFLYLLTHFSIGANSIPLNLYSWFLLKTLGWSELLLRLPLLIAGILSLLIFPLLINKLFNRRTTIIFTFLCAISPFLIFYSRMYRPYSIVVLLSFVSIFLLYFWIKSGYLKYVLGYIATSVLTIYFHPYAAITVLTPLAWVALLKFKPIATHILNKDEKIIPSFLTITMTATSIALLLSILIIPAYMNNSWWLQITGTKQIALKTILNSLYLLSGNTNKIFVLFFIGFFILGQLLFITERTILGSMLFLIVITNCLLLAVNHQDGIHAAIQSSRYMISIFPICFLSAAKGMDYFMQRIQSIGLWKSHKYPVILNNCLATCFLLTIFWTGPLKSFYTRPNNFTNHSAFQESYKSLSWETSFSGDLVPFLSIDKDKISNFYYWLSSQPDKNLIIEYPMYIGDYFNLYYYYQHFHQKEIIVGFDTKLIPIIDREEDTILGNTSISEVLSLVIDTDQLKFKNMIAMNNLEAIKKSHADYIVLHKNLIHEMFRKNNSNQNLINLSLVQLYQYYKSSFGNPVFEDQDIIVFSTSK